ncbi:MAG: cofactor-independent phosphoglycerate mutase [Deltaproteobacteria bacterium RBG_13_65_10]|nr:MAG: cofactor-independent phosphoglycerate mutase [Deltaproteobacteria bacterium RBG_13_65_10]
MKYVILQCDGMPDRPLDCLGGRTPLEVAWTPNLDRLAREGRFGRCAVIPKGFPPGSDIGNLSIFGYEPARFFTGRSPLEAAAMGIPLGPDDVAFRCNLVTLREDRSGAVMEDFACGHIPDRESHEIIRRLNESIGSSAFTFHPGVSYRHLMIWHGGTEKGVTTPPHDITDRPVEPHYPQGEGAEVLREVLARSREVLASDPVNRARKARGERAASSIWLWGQGRATVLPSFRERHGLLGGVISPVDIIRGIAVLAGMRVIHVPGMTGWIDTNYEGKASYALDALRELDLVFVHVEGTDESAHQGNVEAKVKAITDVDGRLLGPILEGLRKLGAHRVMVISDHPTPCAIKTHSPEPVPFAVWPAPPGTPPSEAPGYSESSAGHSPLSVEKGWRIMEKFLSGDL